MLDNEKTVIALGLFDSVHKGHKKVIESALFRAKELNAKCVVVTFDADVKSKLSLNMQGSIFPLAERINRIESLGVDSVYALTTSKEFLSLTPNEFLDYINEKFSVLEYFCGEDYTFGFKAQGNAKTLQEYAEKKGQKASVIPLEKLNGEKISSSNIKSLLKEGKVSIVNKMLTKDYSISGVVTEGRKVGRTIGFPTINLKGDLENKLLKNGVYEGYTFINGKKFKCIINYGIIPSFNIDKVCLEAHILGIDENLYGKQVEIYFTNFIRDIIKFESVLELKKQLEKDLQKVAK